MDSTLVPMDTARDCAKMSSSFFTSEFRLDRVKAAALVANDDGRDWLCPCP